MILEIERDFSKIKLPTVALYNTKMIKIAFYIYEIKLFSDVQKLNKILLIKTIELKYSLSDHYNMYNDALIKFIHLYSCSYIFPLYYAYKILAFVSKFNKYRLFF